jgi:hypothetical protein
MQLDVVITRWEDALEIHEGPERFLTDYSKLPSHVRPIVAGAWCEHEVCNGGFRQFFWNSTGVLAPEAMEAFQLVGLPALASIVEEASAVFGSPFPRERDARCGVLDGPTQGDLTRTLSALDQRFYATLGHASPNAWETAAQSWLDRAAG